MASQIGPQPAQADIEETLASLESLPLFMKSLPSEDSDDVALQALQSLAHDGTADGVLRLFFLVMKSVSSSLEIAQNFKEQGNDYFKGKRFREAIGFYTQGLDAKPTDPSLQEALYCNRAACNLELSMWNLSPMASADRQCRKLWLGTQGLLKSTEYKCSVIKGVISFSNGATGTGPA